MFPRRTRVMVLAVSLVAGCANLEVRSDDGEDGGRAEVADALFLVDQWRDPRSLAGQDSDGDGRSDLDEYAEGTDPNDPSDGPDIDGDGIPNGEDPDVDGDGLLNGEDPDIDGDGRPNPFDRDRDGDGLPNLIDEDDDGDGIP
ncbi:MAG: hypothetical protein GWN07_37670, partial [Actinobacteria bacterium]|nr:hypothetical protein [Actinomycetota bacterium]